MIIKKKLSIILLTAFVLFLTFYLIVYFLGTISEPFKVTKKYVYENLIIESQIGKVISLRLGFLGYSVKYKGPHGKAEFEIIVKGEKGKGIVFTELERELGEWRVKSAKFKSENGEVINII